MEQWGWDGSVPEVIVWGCELAPGIGKVHRVVSTLLLLSSLHAILHMAESKSDCLIRHTLAHPQGLQGEVA